MAQHVLVNIRPVCAEVGYPGADGLNAVGLQLGLGHLQVIGQIVEVHIHHQSAVVVAAAVAAVVCVAGKFCPFNGKVVSPGHLSVNAQVFHCLEDHLVLLRDAVKILRGDYCKIQIPQVVVHGAASGKAAGQVGTVLLHCLHLTFPPRVLVLADYNCIGVLPQVQDHLIRSPVHGQQFLCRQIYIWVCAVRNDSSKFHIIFIPL